MPKLKKLQLPKLPTAGAMYKQRRKDVTSDDLAMLANEVGMGEQAQKIITEKGEQTDRFFSGGIISDVFDAINVLQYGVVGVLKGKSFLEGIQTRESFAKKDALGEFGIPGTIMGIAMDIAVDPFTYIAPWTVLKHVPGLKAIGSAGVKAASKTKAAQWALRKFVFMGGQDKVFKEMFIKGMHDIAGGQAKAMRLLKPLAALDEPARKALKVAREAGDLSKLTPEIRAAALPAYKFMDEMTNKLVDIGMLSPEKAVDILGEGTYLPRLLEMFENPTKKTAAAWGRSSRAGSQALNRLRKKKELPDELLDFYKEIMDGGYVTAKGMVQMNELVAKGTMFHNISKTTHLASKAAQEGFTQLPKSKGLGALSEMWVQGPAAEYINEMIKPRTTGIWRKIIAGFKFGKVILNPATHARNMMSNLVLNGMEGMSIANPRTWKSYGRASKQMATKGDWLQALTEKYGVGMDGMASQEIMSIFKGKEAVSMGKKAKVSFSKLMQKPADLYQNEELFSKTAAFMHHAESLGADTVAKLDDLADVRMLKKMELPAGLTIGEAASRVAERATFNYAQVSPFVRHMREAVWGMPFITFSAKATPQVAKTLVKHPARLSWIGKVKNSIEQMSDIEKTDAERAAEPQWIKDGFYVKLPMSDKHGRSAYFDLTYIIPFGDLVSGQLFERQIDRETGLPESMAESVLKKAPVLNLISEISKNQDFYGNKIWKAGDKQDKQMLDLFRHVSKTYLPPLVGDQIPGGHIAKGRKAGQRRPTKFKRAAEAGPSNQYRTGMQEFLRNVGAKVQPVEVGLQAQYSEWEKRRALQTMLTETGALGEYTRTFRPNK